MRGLMTFRMALCLGAQQTARLSYHVGHHHWRWRGDRNGRHRRGSGKVHDSLADLRSGYQCLDRLAWSKLSGGVRRRHRQRAIPWSMSACATTRELRSVAYASPAPAPDREQLVAGNLNWGSLTMLEFEADPRRRRSSPGAFFTKAIWIPPPGTRHRPDGGAAIIRQRDPSMPSSAFAIFISHRRRFSRQGSDGQGQDQDDTGRSLHSPCKNGSCASPSCKASWCAPSAPRLPRPRSRSRYYRASATASPMVATMTSRCAIRRTSPKRRRARRG